MIIHSKRNDEDNTNELSLNSLCTKAGLTVHEAAEIYGLTYQGFWNAFVKNPTRIKLFLKGAKR